MLTRTLYGNNVCGAEDITRSMVIKIVTQYLVMLSNELKALEAAAQRPAWVKIARLPALHNDSLLCQISLTDVSGLLSTL
jgi:hypothetical protein